MKKINQIFILIFITVILVSAPPVFAAKAVFPDSRELQPMPEHSYPNISGNVNSTVQMNSTPNYQLSGSAPVESPVQTQDQNKKEGSSALWWVLIVIIATSFILYRKYRKK